MSGRVLAFAAIAFGLATSASAQVTYGHGDASPRAAPYGTADDMSYASHPSFQIVETPYGPRTRVVYRCAYPNGWNATDFIRDMNGTPTGIDHTCPDSYPVERHGRAHY